MALEAAGLRAVWSSRWLTPARESKRNSISSSNSTTRESSPSSSLLSVPRSVYRISSRGLLLLLPHRPFDATTASVRLASSPDSARETPPSYPPLIDADVPHPSTSTLFPILPRCFFLSLDYSSTLSMIQALCAPRAPYVPVLSRNRGPTPANLRKIKILISIYRTGSC